MAVGAAVVAAVFLIVLIVLGYGAYKSRRPLIAPEILILPVVAIVLSFAARRLIRNSEGTRTGELFGANLPTVAWWVGLVGILGYGTYLFAIDFSIRRDAEGEVTRWIELVRKPDDPSGPDPLDQAFVRTLEPGRRGPYVGLTDRADLHTRLQSNFRDQLLAFELTDLIRLVRRNPGACDFQQGGLRDWVYRDAGIECVYAGTLRCPEGLFPYQIPLRGFEPSPGAEGAALGRQWQIVLPQTGFLQRDAMKLTPYGWMMLNLERQGGEYGLSVILLASAGPAVHPYLYHAFVRGGEDPRVWCRALRLAPPSSGGIDHPPSPSWFDHVSNQNVQIAAGGGPVVALPYTLDYQAFLRNDFFRAPGGGPPDDEKRTKFLRLWNEDRGITPAGAGLRSSADTAPIIVITPAAVEVRIPVEIPVDTKGEAFARGRLVVACTDPQVLAELQSLRASADPNAATAQEPQTTRDRVVTWRPVRVESDLYAIKPQGPGPGQGPPMPTP
jgi:hypothetical protein